MCSLENGVWLVKYVCRPTQKKKKVIKWSRKATIDEISPAIQRGTLREK